MKRGIYDKYGEDGFKEGMGGGATPLISLKPSSEAVHLEVVEEEVAELVGGKEGGEDLVHKVSLEDLYNGTSKKLSLSRNALCPKCKGKGLKPGPSTKCSGCQDSGMRVSITHLGPSMIQQMQHPCNKCKGSGETVEYKDRCLQCKGEKLVPERKVLEVVVEKGMQYGEKIVLRGEADEAPDSVTGDVVFILQEKEHHKFERKRDDLYLKHTLTLTEALCGFKFISTHLDNRRLLIKSEPGEVIKPNQFKAINNEREDVHSVQSGVS